jgi:hypothetical protein
MICSLAVPEGLRAEGRMYSDDFPNGGYPSWVASRRHDNAFCAAWSWGHRSNVLDRSARVHRLPDVASASAAPESSATAPRDGTDETIGHRDRWTANSSSGIDHSPLRDKERL